ncbi:2-oxo-4-hydroxy-4-carboxy-5-ureidoimidazoline decarboxylase [Rhodoferax sp. 4810]|nr:2-oxo-4-hydroxy-4-carboxy-5-ureidoimidazoline decarboxylase [Rhodoferax jenense]
MQRLNTAPLEEALRLLDGLYEHSPWIAQEALKQRPFKSIHQLKHALTQVLDAAGREAQIGLIRAHPELAGKAMVSQSLTAESTNEQSKAGLTNCSVEEFAKLQQLNAAYNAKFGWPFILAVRGPRGLGLSRAEIIATFERRLYGHPDFELQECLRNIHRIAEIRLNDKFGLTPTLGNAVWDWQEQLAEFSEPGYVERGQLTVTYLTNAHRACAERLRGWMLESGFDSADIDAVGNVVGRYEALEPTAGSDRSHSDTYSYSPLFNKGYSPKKHIKLKTLLTGSHYDTVRNGGKYDGRLGIVVPMVCVRELHRTGRRLPFAIELVAFAEEEGQRFKATFLGSGALTGSFKPEWLDQLDADGVSMLAAMQHAGLCANTDKATALQAIAALKRDPAQYLGFVEVHIEQGPVLNTSSLPLGIVTAINASVRYTGEVIGQASHAGTTPMNQRQDAACAVAELALYLEQRAARDSDSVATMGQLNVPAGSVNVVPGRCSFSLDLRAPNDLQRNNLEGDVLLTLKQICERRGVTFTLQETMRASAAPSDSVWQQRWEAAVSALGLPIHRLPSGAGHDAMKLHEVMPQAMLFVRGQNGGISHNPMESTTSDDMQLAVEAFANLLDQLA